MKSIIVNEFRLSKNTFVWDITLIQIFTRLYSYVKNSDPLKFPRGLNSQLGSC